MNIKKEEKIREAKKSNKKILKHFMNPWKKLSNCLKIIINLYLKHY